MVDKASSTALAERVADRAESGVQVGKTLRDYIIEQTAEIGTGLPPGTLTPERFIRTILTEVRKNPELGNCTRPSFLGAMMQSAQLGLEIGSALGQAYLIPFKNSVRQPDGSWAKVLECSFLIGYKGWVNLAARSGILLEAREVCENDKFEFRYGTTPILEHGWDPKRDRGDVAFYYGTASMPDGRIRFHVMSLDEIEKRRMRGGAARSNAKSPWDTDYDAMCRKTVIRAMVPQLPMSAEMSDALAADEGVVTRRDNGDLRVSFPDAIPVEATPTLTEKQALLSEIVAGTEPVHRHNLSSHLLKAFGPLSELSDEQAQAAIDVALGWPETAPSSETGATAPESRPDDDPGPPEPPEAANGLGEGVAVPRELIEATQSAVDTWTDELVAQNLSIWEVPVARTASGVVKRKALARVLAKARNENVQAAIDLF